MKKFSDWRMNEALVYNPQIDGKPLEPHTISGAEVQIKTLAQNIRTTFNRDPRFARFHEQIEKATQLLDQAAATLDLDAQMSGDDRNAPHNFHNP